MVALFLLLALLQATPTTPPKTPSPTNPNPTTAAKAPRPRPSNTTTTVLLFITDASGRPIEGVTVNFMGPVDREVKSPASGPTRIEGLRAGTYRVRFAHDGFISFEKEISWRAGTAAPELSITLNSAPAAPAPPPPPPAPVKPEPSPSSKLPPPGDPKSLSLLDFIEKNFISNREPQKENLIGCSGVGQTMLWQIRDPWTGREHASADATIYVVAGEGTLKLGEREVQITNGSFAVVPRGTTYSFTKRGRNPLIVLAVLSGAPCAAD